MGIVVGESVGLCVGANEGLSVGAHDHTGEGVVGAFSTALPCCSSA